MRTLLRLRICCSAPEAASRLAAVLSPDNDGTPSDLNFSMSRTKETVSFKLSSARPSSVLSTAVAVLNDVSLFEEVSLLSQRRHARVQEKNER